MKTETAIGFGSNLGDRLANLGEALRRLEALPGVRLLEKSSVYETEPVGVPAIYASLDFLNAVAIFEVTLECEAWSGAVHAIEDAMLRQRTGVRNAPRIIDLDILYFGDCMMDQPHLHLPHPQCVSRRFVCAPLAELRPGLVLPGETRTISAILANLPLEPKVVKLETGN
ncbi:MAG: 2-amino-4-hydroxy-6-hydroxymethyldihydropteridine diphosphokinase [Kiritimatiellia bacterium]|jgi:2-amino-4-hydroxy-6-hydroxymethyldihydropteridine diphosphokinase